MKNNAFYTSAIALDFTHLQLVIYSEIQIEIKSFVLLQDGQKYKVLTPKRRVSLHAVYFYEFVLNEDLKLGHQYSIAFGPDFSDVIINLGNLSQNEKFDELYSYDGDDLGATYHQDYTDFALWAPLANRVYLKIARPNEDNFTYYALSRSTRGVYRLRLNGDYEGARYRYIVNNFGNEKEVIDPYAKSGFGNSSYSAIINLDKIKEIPSNREHLPFFKSNCHAIIYEASVRDMTIHPHTDIAQKGKFLGMIERNKKTRKGHPAGYDYLTSLGFTHLQLLPILDFDNVDEYSVTKKYNWGYDPIHYFTLEGSYSSNPDDPYARMIEFKKLVSAYHEAGIRINLDVVYNHVYEVEYSLYERIVPNYFFRRENDGRRANQSWCGNVFASERKMGRKLILDSIKFLFETYDIDGLRFDLMGLMDVNTMKEISSLVKKLRGDAMLYGEGWNMGSTPYDHSPSATLDNAQLLPEYAFFNDRYRNIVKGLGQETHLEENGFLLGNNNFLDGFKFVYSGSCINRLYPKLFLKASQSINYVECHDNGTIFDVIDRSLDKESLDDKLNRLLLINKTILMSFGIPFFHMGQEIGLSKKFHTNTYNEGDLYNQFDYDVLDKRYHLIEHFQNAIKMRKELSFLRIDESETIDDMLAYLPCDDALLIDFKGELLHKYDSFKIFINPYLKTIYYDLDDNYTIYYPGIQAEEKSIKVNHAMIPPLSAVLFFK